MIKGFSTERGVLIVKGLRTCCIGTDTMLWLYIIVKQIYLTNVDLMA